jgi:hypothetical protein
MSQEAAASKPSFVFTRPALLVPRPPAVALLVEAAARSPPLHSDAIGNAIAARADSSPTPPDELTPDVQVLWCFVRFWLKCSQGNPPVLILERPRAPEHGAVYARVIFDYQGDEEEGELSVQEGQRLQVISRVRCKQTSLH